MKIENKIILSNIFNITLILLTGFFAMQNLNLMLTKLRFVEIADDLNASFLEMRLSEKNYFLYRDDSALLEIKEKIDITLHSLDLMRKDIIKAVGEKNFETLQSYLRSYSGVVDAVRGDQNRRAGFEAEFRAEGKKLREFSNAMTKLERAGVNNIIANSKNFLFASFWAIVLCAIVVGHFISQKILRSLRDIERLANSISRGNFSKIEGDVPKDEFGSLISAVNSMSEELRNREEELIQSKKLASLGILTAGVAHELTNPLNNISMIAQNYLEYYPQLSNEKRIELMGSVEKETMRIEEIVKNLLDFSKPKEGNYERGDIAETVRRTIPLVQNMINISNIDLHIFFEPAVPLVYIDEHQIQQVIVNLIVNAIQAMQPGSSLYISTKFGDSPETAKVEIRDTGKGIPPEFLPHIFDPFFSTKGVSGTGLGLSVSYSIIKNHGGNIRVESEVGVGTTFTIELPAFEKVK